MPARPPSLPVVTGTLCQREEPQGRRRRGGGLVLQLFFPHNTQFAGCRQRIDSVLLTEKFCSFPLLSHEFKYIQRVCHVLRSERARLRPPLQLPHHPCPGLPPHRRIRPQRTGHVLRVERARQRLLRASSFGTRDWSQGLYHVLAMA